MTGDDECQRLSCVNVSRIKGDNLEREEKGLLLVNLEKKKETWAERNYAEVH